MSLADIISDAQSMVRQSDGITTATYLQWLNRINRTYCRSQSWPQMRVLNSTITTVANQAAYDLPANYNRMSGDFVYWDPGVIIGGYENGIPIPFIPQGTPQLDSRISGFTDLGNGGYMQPLVAYVANGEDGALQLVLAPYPSFSGTLILFSYYADPVEFEDTTDEIPIPQLYDTYVNALAKQIAIYLDDGDVAALYAAEERKCKNAVLANLFPN